MVIKLDDVGKIFTGSRPRMLMRDPFFGNLVISVREVTFSLCSLVCLLAGLRNRFFAKFVGKINSESSV